METFMAVLAHSCVLTPRNGPQKWHGLSTFWDKETNKWIETPAAPSTYVWRIMCHYLIGLQAWKPAEVPADAQQIRLDNKYCTPPSSVSLCYDAWFEMSDQTLTDVQLKAMTGIALFQTRQLKCFTISTVLNIPQRKRRLFLAETVRGI